MIGNEVYMGLLSMSQTSALIRAITEANATNGMTIENSCLAVIDLEDFTCMYVRIKDC